MKIKIPFFMLWMPFLSAHAELPTWLQGWKPAGDARVRLEGIDFDEDDRKTLNRARYRLRIGAAKDLSKRLHFGFRLTSGTGAATSTNDSFDNSFSGKRINVDRAYLIYGDKEDWTIGAGKMINPLHSSDIVWDTDVNPEGAYGSVTPGVFYFTLMGAVLEEEPVLPDTTLAVFQAGIKTKGFFSFNGSLSYYYYEGLQVTPNNFLDYSFVDAVADFSFKSTVPFSFTLNYVNNDSSDITSEDTAYGAFFTFGKSKKAGDWWFMFKYASIEAFSVNGIFADSDFGFSDAEGFVGEVRLQTSKRGQLRASFWDVEGILDEDRGFQRVQLDYNIRL